jgi:hypothetical protein
MFEDLQLGFHIFGVIFLDDLFDLITQLGKLLIIYNFQPVDLPNEISIALHACFKYEVRPLIKCRSIRSNIDIFLSNLEYWHFIYGIPNQKRSIWQEYDLAALI